MSGTPDALRFTCHGGGVLELVTDPEAAPELRLICRLRTEALRASADDRFDPDVFTGFWERLGRDGGDECHLHGAEGRIVLILRWTDSTAGVRLELRPATGMRVELETEVGLQRSRWREVVAGWLRERDAADPELPWM